VLTRALEQGKSIKESTFAVNSCLIGRGALLLAMGKLDEAEKILDQAIRTLSGSGEAALRELRAVALRFHAEIHAQRGDLDAAEQDLQEALELLESLGVDGAVQLAYAMSDMAIIYVKQGALDDAGALVISSMELLRATLGPESPEYVRANLI